MPSLALRAGRLLAILLVAGALVFPFVGGYPLAYLLMAVTLLLILWWLVSQPSIAELREPAGLMMAGAVVLIALAFALTAREPHDLVYAGNFTMLALFPLLRAALARFAAPSNTQIVAVLALIGTGIAMVVGVIQVVALQYGRATGLGSDPIWAGQAAMVIGFVALVGLMVAPDRWRNLFLLGPVLGTFTASLTGSRGPLLAAIPLFVVAFVLAAGRRREVIAAAAVAAVVSTLGVSMLIPGASSRMASIAVAATETIVTAETKDQAVASRQSLYRAGAQAFLSAPLAGHGWERRVDAAYAFIPGGAEAMEAGDAVMAGNRHLHADLLDLGVGAGLLGLIAYGLALLAPVVGAHRSPRDGQYHSRLTGALLLATGYFFCGLTYIMLGYEFPTTLYVCLAAILLGFCRDPQVPAPAAEPAIRLAA